MSKKVDKELQAVIAKYREFRLEAQKHAYYPPRYARDGSYNDKDWYTNGREFYCEGGRLLEEFVEAFEEYLLKHDLVPRYEPNNTRYCDNPGRGY